MNKKLNNFEKALVEWYANLSVSRNKCLFVCLGEKYRIYSIRAPPCRILKLTPISKSRYGGKHNEKVIDRENHEKRRKKNYRNIRHGIRFGFYKTRSLPCSGYIP